VVGETVADLVLLTGGASRATWAFSTPTRQLILRLDPPMAIGHQMELEARCIRAAAACGVPVPGIVSVSDDASALGSSYMILERIAGETIPRRILRDGEFAQGRERLVSQSAAALAAIHRVDPDAVAGLEESDQLASWAAKLHELAEGLPALEAGLKWLEQHRPPGGGRVLVHGDFRMGNLMVDSQGLRSVLDWELSHVGDPLEDLGWMCVRAWRFGSPLPVLGLGTYEELSLAYEAAGGGPVDPEGLFWWELFGTWRWGIMCAAMAATARAFGSLSVEMAAIGRRTCENEWDVLHCLALAGLTATAGPEAEAAPGAVPGVDGEPAPTRTDLHGPPRLEELVAAVRGWIDDSVRPAVDPTLAFHARVASNVLATIKREIELGPGQQATHLELLTRLGVASEAELAAAIRCGSLAYDDPEVLGAIRWGVKAKLDVAHPGYGDARAEK
jgi:aminoglycoside phosphotransferase (APT) family kinase protein